MLKSARLGLRPIVPYLARSSVGYGFEFFGGKIRMKDHVNSPLHLSRIGLLGL